MGAGAALADPDRRRRFVEQYLGDSAAELLGQAFFFDKAFSGVPTEVDAINRPSPPARTPNCQPLAISCASCHDLARAGVDTTSVPGHVSVGAGWTDVNALAVVNSAYRPVVFWNGRADSLWALNVVVAESPTTLNGIDCAAHQIADRYAGFYDDVFAKRFLPLDIAAINKLPANGKPKPEGTMTISRAAVHPIPIHGSNRRIRRRW